MLEEFYGEALSDQLLQRIHGTDDEQLAVLAWQLVQRLPIVEAEVARPRIHSSAAAAPRLCWRTKRC